MEREVNEGRLASVLAQLPAFFAILRGPEHRFEFANPAYAQLVGHRDLIGRPVREVLPEVESQGYIDLLDRVFRSGEPYLGREMPLALQRHRGGSTEERFVNFVYEPLREADGEVSGIVAHGVDVTELVQARSRAEEQTRLMEAQTEELQHQAIQLEETQVELEATNAELIAATHEAEESRSWLEGIIRQLPSGVIVAEASTGRIVLGNEQVERILKRGDLRIGIPLDAAPLEASRPDGAVYQPSEWPLARALRGETINDELMAIRRGDAGRSIISVNATPVRAADGSVQAAVAIFDDVTEQWQHQAEQEFLVEAARLLASSLDYQETLGAVARLAVPRIADWCVIDVLEGGELRRLAAVHDDTAKQALAAHIGERWPTSIETDIGVARVLRTGQAELYGELTEDILRQVAQDEEHLAALREVGLRSAMILPMAARGRTVGAITLIFAQSDRRYTAEDIRIAEKLASRGAMAVDNARLYREARMAREEAERARRHAEEALSAAEAANRAKSDFLASMSHEIRTPLNAVTGYTELLELGIAGPLNEQQLSHLGRIRKSTAHLLSLVNDLLDLARIESGKMEVYHETARADRAAEAALALVGPQAASRGVVLENRCEGESIAYFGDQDRVRQILVNIIGNAVKFTRPGGRVSISCGTEEEAAPGANALSDGGPWTCFTVEDNGIGIAADQLERIFRPFEQANSGYTREAGGAGLGLSISRQLAVLMGGDITATSRPGVGSVFTLWMPQFAPPELLPIEEVPVEEEGRGFADIGRLLIREMDSVIEKYARNLRADAQTPGASGLDEADLKDHHATLLADLGASLLAMGPASDAQRQLLKDGSEIQRVVGDLHGRQRAQLGWDEEALQREFEILAEALRARLTEAADAEEERLELEAALRVIGRLLERVRHVSLRALRAARAGMQGAEG